MKCFNEILLTDVKRVGGWVQLGHLTAAAIRPRPSGRGHPAIRGPAGARRLFFTDFTPKTTKQYTEARKRLDEEAELLFERAAKEIIDIQLEAGVTIPTDGEVRRENYIHYHCRHLTGFDFENLEGLA